MLQFIGMKFTDQPAEIKEPVKPVSVNQGQPEGQNIGQGQQNIGQAQQNIGQAQQNIAQGQQNLPQGQQNIDQGQQNIAQGQNIDQAQQNIAQGQNIADIKVNEGQAHDPNVAQGQAQGQEAAKIEQVVSVDQAQGVKEEVGK